MQEAITRYPQGVRWINWLVGGIALLLMVLLLAPAIQRMSFNVWLGAIATGLGFGFVALAVYLTFRVLDFPDLTIDGTLPLGAALTATLLTAGVNPYLTLPIAFAGGAVAGTATALIATRLRIHSLLASILVTTGLVSINLRIMGRSNVPLLNTDSLFTPLATPFHAMLESLGGEALARMSTNLLTIVVFLVLVLCGKFAIFWFRRTELGLALVATGDNPLIIGAMAQIPTT